MGGFTYWTCATVWDSAGDNALTVVKWMGAMRPKADDTDGSFLNQSGSAVDMYQSVDELSLLTSSHVTTTTDPDEVRFTVDSTDIDAAWTPTAIIGVLVTASVRGDGVLNSARVVIEEGAVQLYGGAEATDADTSISPSRLFLTQADGVSGWDAANIDSHSFGVEVT